MLRRLTPVATVVALLWCVKKNMQGIWRAGLNWSAGRVRPAGRSLATPAVGILRGS